MSKFNIDDEVVVRYRLDKNNYKYDKNLLGKIVSVTTKGFKVEITDAKGEKKYTRTCIF